MNNKNICSLKKEDESTKRKRKPGKIEFGCLLKGGVSFLGTLKILALPGLACPPPLTPILPLWWI